MTILHGHKADSQFADVSSNDGPSNLAAYSSAGHLAIMVKATEDTGYVNPYHAGECAQAHAHKLSVFHYHFARPENANPEGQANHFWTTVRPFWRTGIDRLVVDIETGDANTWRTWAHDFDRKLYTLSHATAVGYTYASGYDFLAGALLSRRYHLAAWGDVSPPKRLVGSDTLWAWQYTDGVSGPLPHVYAGVGRCDGSLLNAATLGQLHRALRRK